MDNHICHTGIYIILPAHLSVNLFYYGGYAIPTDFLYILLFLFYYYSYKIQHTPTLNLYASGKHSTAFIFKISHKAEYIEMR